MNHPLLLILMTLAGLYTGWLWLADRRAAKAGVPHPGALPGATPAPARATGIAVMGALIILAGETIGEKALGLDAQQSHMTWLSALYSIAAAPFIEELIFRGWLVLTTRGATIMWGAVVTASVIFAALHPFLWHWDDSGFAVTFSAKGWFSTGAVFATSLWLYVVRLAGWNPARSLLPCFAAHAAKNLGVVAIKAATGFVAGAW